MPAFHPRMPLLMPALLVSACLFVPAANAQTQSPSSPPAAQAPAAQAPAAQAPSPSAPGAPAQSAPAPNIPEQKLGAAAAALQQVAGIKQDYERRLAAASDSDKQRLVDEANTALVKAVTDQGLSVEEYTNIMVIAQNDPQVREKLLQRLPQQAPAHPADQPNQ